MNVTQSIGNPEKVASWPRVTGVLHGPSSRLVNGFYTQAGSITIYGTERACEASSVEELRIGMLARCAAIAARLRRPIRFTVTDGASTWELGVRPSGIVQPLNDAGMIAPPGALQPIEGRCRVCRRLQPITETTCGQCGTPEPHRVETEPLDVAAVIPDAEDAVEELEHTILSGRRTPPPAPRPTLRLRFSTQRSVDTAENVAIGRQPAAVNGRAPVPVRSPEGLLSRTHALLDVDEEGRIVLTDNHSANGIEMQTDPPRALDPGVPYVIEPGTTFVMGDVECTVSLAS